MMMKSPAYLAGYRSAQEPSNELLRAIEPPETYTSEERDDFISGFLSGARAARDEELIAEIIADEEAKQERQDNGPFGVGA